MGQAREDNEGGHPMEPEMQPPQPTHPAREVRLGAIARISLLLSGLVCLIIVLSWLGPQPTPGNCFLPWWLPFFNWSAIPLLPVSLVFGIVTLLAETKGDRGLGIVNIILAPLLFLAVVGANF